MCYILLGVGCPTALLWERSLCRGLIHQALLKGNSAGLINLVRALRQTPTKWECLLFKSCEDKKKSKNLQKALDKLAYYNYIKVCFGG